MCVYASIRDFHIHGREFEVQNVYHVKHKGIMISNQCVRERNSTACSAHLKVCVKYIYIVFNKYKEMCYIRSIYVQSPAGLLRKGSCV